MSQEAAERRQIEVDVSGFFRTHHRFLDGESVWGELTYSAFGREGALQTAEGRRLIMRRTHLLGSQHELLDGGVRRGIAERRGLLSRDIIIEFDGQHYLLEPEGFLSQSWRLTDLQGRLLLTVQPWGILRHGAHVSVHEDVEPDLLVFTYYLVQMRQEEDSAAAAAAVSAAAS